MPNVTSSNKYRLDGLPPKSSYLRGYYEQLRKEFGRKAFTRNEAENCLYKYTCRIRAESRFKSLVVAEFIREEE